MRGCQNNHFAQVEEQLSREPRALPRLSVAEGVRDIFAVTYADLKLDAYTPHPSIKAAVAV